MEREYLHRLRIGALLLTGALLSSVFNPSGTAWAAPQVISTNPSSAGAGAAAKNIAVYGTGFQCGVSVSFSDPGLTTPNEVISGNAFNNQCGTAGIIQSNVQFFSVSNVYFYLNVSGSTVPGVKTVTLTNPDGSAANFSITITPPPQITSVTPLSGGPGPVSVPQGGTTNLVINGSGFQNGAVLSGIFTVNSFYVNSGGNQATANITVSASAVPALNAITVTNPDGGKTLFAAGFLVQWLLGAKTPAMTVYEDPRITNGIQIPFNFFWNGGWSNQGNILPPSVSAYTPSEMVVRPHPFLFQQILGHQLGGHVEFQIWNDGAWGNELSVQSLQSTRDFDMAFEANTGNGLIVYGTATGVSYRRIFQSGSLAACDSALGVSSPCFGPENLLETFPYPDFLYSLKLIANPDRTKNEILLATLRNSGILSIDRWDGNAFYSQSQGSPVQVSANARVDFSTFDLAYMQSSKTGMLAWLENGSGTPAYCLWNTVQETCAPNGSNPAQTGSTPATASLFRIQLAPSLASDQIALGTIEMASGNGRLATEIWSGTAWPASASLLSTIMSPIYSNFDWNEFSLVWPNGSLSGQLFAVYTDINGGLDYRIWNGGWSGSAQIPGTAAPVNGSAPVYESIAFDSDPRSGDVLGVTVSQNSLVASVRWDEPTLQWVEYTTLANLNILTNYPFVAFSYFRDFPTEASLNTAPARPIPQGTALTATVTGTLIKDFALLAFPGFVQSAQDTTTVTHNAATGIDTLVATGTIDPNAIPGTYDVMVTNPDGSLVVIPGGMQIILNPAYPPTITAVSPNSRGQGAANQILTFTGYNFPLLAGSPDFSISFTGSGTITAGAPVFLPSSATQFTLQVGVDPAAAAGSHTIVLTNLSTSQSYSFPNLFSVNYAPSLVSVTPSTLTQGQSQSIVVNGNDFQPGASVVLSNGSQALGWNTPGGTPSDLFQNRMSGNRLAFPAGSAPYALLRLVSVLTTLVDPQNVNGQMAIYSDNNGVPGSLVQVSAVTPLTTINCLGSPCSLNFNLTSPIILDTTKKYWMLFNADGLQTLLAYDAKPATCNNDTPCLSVSSPETFGSWPANGSGISWNPLSGSRRYAMDLFYQPVIGSPQVGASTDLPGQTDQYQYTGSNVLTLGNNIALAGIYYYVGSVDPSNPSASIAVYDSAGTGGSPDNPVVTGILNNALQPNSFNYFPFSHSTLFLTNTYWLLFDAKGSGTSLNYDSGPGVTASAINAGSGSTTWPPAWPNPFPFGSTTLEGAKRYSAFAVVSTLPSAIGSASGGSSDGPDSNQMTGTSFTTSQVTTAVGMTFYIDTIDPVSNQGSAAIYDDNGGAPGNLRYYTVSQTLNPAAFNTISGFIDPSTGAPLPIIQLPSGKYWLMVNVNGRGTTLTYDTGTTANSVKEGNLFSNAWPLTGGVNASWTQYPGRRYAIAAVGDVTVNNSNVISSNVLSSGITVDPNGSLTVSRPVCVINPDGGEACATLNSGGQPLIQIVSTVRTNPALNAYGSVPLAPDAAYRTWNGAAPWSAEGASPVSSGGAPNWSVLRSFPNANLSGTRKSEKILGTESPSALTFQIWNGLSWNLAYTAAPTAIFSRAFDIAYESGTGRAIAVYGAAGNGAPLYTMTDGTGWSAPQPVPGSPVGNPLWIRLEPNPLSGSREIVLAYLSGSVDPVNGPVTNAALHLLVWNGSGFGNEQVISLAGAGDNINLCGTCLPAIVGQPFDLAYEHQSGRALAGFGLSGTIVDPVPQYLVWNGSQWSPGSSGYFATTSTASSTFSPLYIRMTGDPNSNRIAMGSGYLNGQAYDIRIWDGLSTWGSPTLISSNLLFNADPASLAPDPNFNVGRAFDLAFEKDSGELVTVFASSTSVNMCEYKDQYGNAFPPFPYGTRFKQWDPVNGWTADALVPLIGRDLVPKTIQLVQEPQSNDLFLEILGQPVIVYNPSSNPNQYPDTTLDYLCIIAQSQSRPTSSDPTLAHYHHYVWSNRSWLDREVISTSASGAVQSAIGLSGTYTAFGESFMTAFDPDQTPPAPVTDLKVTGATGTSLTLQWTSTGDDGSFGKAASYPIYYSTTSPFSGTLVAIFTPVIATLSAETYSYTVTGLSTNTSYYFAIQAVDRAGNGSLLSSTNPPVTGYTTASGETPPGPVSDLSIVPGSVASSYDNYLKQEVTSLQLTWTAPWVSSSYGGTGAAYDLRYCNAADPACVAPIVDNASFNAAHAVLAKDGSGRNGLSPPHAAGSREIFNFIGLAPGTTYFSIKSCSGAGMDPVSFRCTGDPLAISQIDLRSAATLSSAQCYPLIPGASCVTSGAIVPVPAPAPVSDLNVTSAGSNSVTLRWTVPMNALVYDIRYSTLPIVENGTPVGTPPLQVVFNNATGVPSLPVPQAGNTVQSFSVTNLLSNTTGIRYYFAIKSINSTVDPVTGATIPNPSAISNVPSATTLPVFDSTPPGRIIDLNAVSNGITRNSVLLSWTATGDDGAIGRAMQYDLRYSELEIVENGTLTDPSRQVEFQNAMPVAGLPAPQPAGNREFFTVPGLNSNTVYTFAIKAIDKGSNASPISSSCAVCANPLTVAHTALHAGYNLVSIPYRFNSSLDPATVFGNDLSKPVTLYQWVSGNYEAPSLITEATGYFLFAAANNSVLRASDSGGNPLGVPETAADFAMPLSSGWNIIGNPYLHPVYLKDTCIRPGFGASVPFATAVGNGWVGSAVYSFDGTQYLAERYQDILPPTDPNYQPPALLGPWNGYWLQLLTGSGAYYILYPDSPGICP